MVIDDSKSRVGWAKARPGVFRILTLPLLENYAKMRSRH